MKIQTISFGDNNTLVFVYNSYGSNQASAYFTVFAKRVVDKLKENAKTGKLFLYLQHYMTNGSLLTRGVDACNFMVTDKRHKAEVKFSIDSLKKNEDEIYEEIMKQWSSYVSLTASIPFDVVI